MADTAYLPTTLAIDGERLSEQRRHSFLVRVTHWIYSLSFIGLVVSGVGILLAHPRFYWGETGGLGTPSILDLPLPFMLGGPSGWGRYLHFLSAWVCVLTGVLYVLSGLLSRHFEKEFVPSRHELSWKSISGQMASHLRLQKPAPHEALRYNVLQRLSYAAVVFVLLPAMLWTGMAMSPAVVSVFPFFVTVLGGHQTARTLHFFLAVLLVIFLLVHVAMVILAGFKSRVGAMITGKADAGKERA
jgi:thiosulfate reductase cytochrome b subunit